MATTAPDALPAPIALSSPCGKRKRELQSDTDESSPQKLRMIHDGSPLTVAPEEKENLKNSPTARGGSSKRIKRITSKIKKRTSMSFLSPKATASISLSCSYPASLVSPPKVTAKHTKVLKDAIENPKKRTLSQLQNLEKKKTFRSPIRRVPSFRNSRDVSQLPKITGESKEPNCTSPTGPPSLSRSISLYSLPKLENEADTPRKTPVEQPRKRKKASGSISSLKNSRKRSVTDFKLLFTRGSSQASLIEEKKETSDNEKIPQRKYFSVDIVELMNRQRELLGDTLKIPYFIHVCCHQIRSKFLCEEGLFRISPSLSALNEAVKLIESSSDFGEDNLTICDNTSDSATQFKSHVYSGLLKQFLRELPDPLLGFENYAKWVSCITPNEDLPGIEQLVNDLHPDRYNLLKEIISLVYVLSENSHANRMSIDSLSRVIGPNILWNHLIQDPIASSEQIGIINHLAESLITNYKVLFLKENNETTKEEIVTLENESVEETSG